ncbi:MAG: PHP-associated domain-containing protein [Acidobacteriota bacterium]
MSGWLKVDLHLHTREDPNDGGRMVVHSPEELIRHAAGQGFQVLAITNHNQLLYTMELAEFAEGLGILLLPGVEATLRGRHVLLYNFLGYRPSWNTFEQVREAKGADQLVIAPHPFYPVAEALRDLFFEWIDLFDAVELSSLSMRGLDFNRRAAREARRRGLPLVGNSDTHFLYQLGRTYTMVRAEREVGSVLQAIRRGDVRVVAQPNGPLFVARFFLGGFRNRLLYALHRQQRRGRRAPGLSSPSSGTATPRVLAGRRTGSLGRPLLPGSTGRESESE